jgi:CheY-like chemotaxis protein
VSPARSSILHLINNESDSTFILINKQIITRTMSSDNRIDSSLYINPTNKYYSSYIFGSKNDILCPGKRLPCHYPWLIMKERRDLSKLILVVDDDEGLQETLQAVLEGEDYEVVIAGDGLAALEKLATVMPALILLDLMMPRMDGFTFALELERRGLRSSIPIIVLTADSRGKQKANQLGANNYIDKPFDIPDLLDKIAQFM